MRMIKFGGVFPEVAARHMLVLRIDPPEKPLPVKTYALLEYYCNEPDCDCRRIVLDATSSDQPGRISPRFWLGKHCVLPEVEDNPG